MFEITKEDIDLNVIANKLRDTYIYEDWSYLHRLKLMLDLAAEKYKENYKLLLYCILYYNYLYYIDVENNHILYDYFKDHINKQIYSIFNLDYENENFQDIIQEIIIEAQKIEIELLFNNKEKYVINNFKINNEYIEDINIEDFIQSVSYLAKLNKVTL